MATYDGGDDQAALRSLAPYDLDYVHRGSRDEPLVSLPDAVGWAWGAGGEWRRAVAPLVASVARCDRPRTRETRRLL